MGHDTLHGIFILYMYAIFQQKYYGTYEPPQVECHTYTVSCAYSVHTVRRILSEFCWNIFKISTRCRGYCTHNAHMCVNSARMCVISARMCAFAYCRMDFLKIWWEPTQVAWASNSIYMCTLLHGLLKLYVHTTCVGV
jgi:hypothetical protein